MASSFRIGPAFRRHRQTECRVKIFLQADGVLQQMKNASSRLLTAQILGGLAASAALYVAGRALMPSRGKSRQVVVITGGSRGLGLAMAKRFARSGAKVVLSSRSEEDLSIARDTLIHTGAVADADDILLVSADLRDREQAAGLVDAAIRTFGRIDVLINNAGIIEVGPVEDQPLEAYERAMQTNYFAALYVTYAALPHLLRRFRETGHKAAIVNIASIGGKFAMPHLLPYVASKFALVGFSEGLHAELRFKGVRVTTVCPGLMRTGGEEHAEFIGQAGKEQGWFQFSAKTPGLSASVGHAANRVFNAVACGSAEITITPQAWLAARVSGAVPGVTQYVAALASHLLLPGPVDEGMAGDSIAARPEAVPSPS